MSMPSEKSFPATVVTPIPVDPYIRRIDDRRRCVMLVAGIFTATAISTHYCFNLISEYLKSRYQYGQAELTVISTVGTSVGAFTFPAGVVFDYLGASVAVAVPCSIATVGFVLLGLTFSDHIAGSVVRLSVFYATICLGASSMDTGSLMTNILNFPRDRGAVLVLQKTFNGLGTSILAIWFASFFPNRYDTLAFFTAGVVFLFGMAGATFLRLPPYYLTAWQRKSLSEEEVLAREVTRDIYMTQRPSKRRLGVGYVVLAILFIFVTVQSLVVAYVDVAQRTQLVMGIVTTCLLVSLIFIALPVRFLDAPDADANSSADRSPLKTSLPETRSAVTSIGVEPCGARRQLHDHREEVMHRESGGLDDPLLQPRRSQRHSYAATLPGPPPERIPEPQYQGDFSSHLLFLDIWLLFWTCFCNWGTGHLIVANVTQIYRSMNNNHYVASANTLYITLIGVGSAFGRVITGCIEMVIDKRAYAAYEKLQQQQRYQQQLPILPHTKRKLHIIMVYPLPSVLMTLSLGILLLIPVEGIVVPLVLISFALGYSLACTTLVVRSLFAREVGKHYNFLFFGSSCANIALNRFMFGELFDREGRRTGMYPHCAGRRCVQTSFLILLGLNATAMVTSELVCWRFLHYVSQEEQQQQNVAHDYIDDYNDIR
ncbi:hypothetical protein DQ04_06281010 [Trypanosoma grayi]|uniref:hypothetical protein n=1 Tax=Trypanosoma grayi TaxID=71804 RepID=UPI0004F4A735|nr:hypothetical protein DQ04_06281010 [Trypanosoma grayi]KEG08866.1 hypothetical protein DQ04_06281010 [Trypanosoma grayi]